MEYCCCLLESDSASHATMVTRFCSRPHLHRQNRVPGAPFCSPHYFSQSATGPAPPQSRCPSLSAGRRYCVGRRGCVQSEPRARGPCMLARRWGEVQGRDGEGCGSSSWLRCRARKSDKGIPTYDGTALGLPSSETFSHYLSRESTLATVICRIISFRDLP